MRTWEIEVNKHLTIKVKSQKKAEAEDLSRDIRQLFNITSYRKELSGIHGESENEHIVMTMGGYNALENPSVFSEDFNSFLASIPPVIEDVAEVHARAIELFKKHIPVVNSRKTRLQANKEAEESRKIHDQFEAVRNTEREAFIEKWGLKDKVDIPEGMMAVYLEITYDNSDPMSDSYHPHAQIGEDLLLGMVPEGKRTERIAREMLSRYPELESQSWTWRVETYSMGHGTYLISNFTGIKMPPHFKSTDEVNTRFEIRFGTREKSMHPYRGFKASYMPSASVIERAGAVTMRLNEAHNGVELTFGSTPSREVVTELKANGFCFHGRRRMWYAKQSEITLALAQRLSVVAPVVEEASEAVPEAAQSETPIPNVPEYRDEEAAAKPRESESPSGPIVSSELLFILGSMPTEQLSMF